MNPLQDDMRLESYSSRMSEHSRLKVNETLKENCKYGASGHSNVSEST